MFRHLFTGDLAARRAFPEAALARIERAVRESESRHAGQIRFAVEGGLDFGDLVRGLPARERAIDLFSMLRIWDTEHNNGVLIYLLLADRDVEIVADRGIAARVGQESWESICRAMEAAFREGRFVEGVEQGIAAATAILESHFPGPGSGELSDRPVVISG